jgi:hypothetical protein
MSNGPKQEKPAGMQEMLDEIHRRNRDRSEQDQRQAPAAGPQVGIVWELNGALFIEGVSLTEAESWGQFKNYPGSHEKMWRKYQRIDAVARDLEYDAPPRGRVVYDMAGQQFHLYADVCILRNETLVAKIRSDLHLPPKVEAAPDDHYRCAKCLAASPSDKDL